MRKTKRYRDSRKWTTKYTGYFHHKKDKMGLKSRCTYTYLSLWNEFFVFSPDNNHHLGFLGLSTHHVHVYSEYYGIWWDWEWLFLYLYLARTSYTRRDEHVDLFELGKYSLIWFLVRNTFQTFIPNFRLIEKKHCAWN